MTSLVSRMKAQVGIDPVVRQCADHDVELSQSQPPDQPVGKTGVDGEADVGILRHHARDRDGQVPAQPRGSRADARVPDLAAGDADDLRARLGKLRLDQFDMLGERASRFGQLDAAAAPVVKPRAELALQTVHALGQPGLA